MNRKLLGIILCLLLIFCIIIGLNIFKKNTVTLVITNETNEDIDYLHLNYTGLKKDMDIPIIRQKDTIKFKVNIDEDFHEGSMKIYYIDDDGNQVDFYVIGYFESAPIEKIKVTISKENNKLQIMTEE